MLKKRKKTNFNIIFFILLTLTVCVVSFSMARYQTSLRTQADVFAADWNVKVYLNEQEITNQENLYKINIADTMQPLADTIKTGTIAPGSRGSFEIKLDFTGTETGVEYTINFVKPENMPSNFKLYTEENFNIESEIPFNKQQVAYVALANINTPVIEPIYWKWEKADDETINAEEILQSGGNLSIDLKINTQQYIDDIPEETTDEKYFEISAQGELSLNPDNLLEFDESITSLVIPSQIRGIQVKKIQDELFAENNKITSVVVPSGIETIGESAFQSCNNLSRVTIANTVTTINANAFYNCTNLKQVSLSSGLQRIEGWAFDNCTTLTNIIIPETVEYIGESAFYNCSTLANISLPETIQIINKWTFWNCTSLTNIQIPNQVQSIEEGAFGKCTKLSNITIGTGVSKIGDSAFYMNTSLEQIVIPTNVLTIERLAFAECTNLKQATIPETTSVDETAFENCAL